ncbi:hypothetical protein ABEF91_005182 [Exophiala dermatitidis]
MDSSQQDISETRRSSLFDYSEVVTLMVGKGKRTTQHCFSASLPRLCSESPYLKDRLFGNHQEARGRNIQFGTIDPRTVVCMLYWFRGWTCPYCHEDAHHIVDSYVLAQKYNIPRFKSDLVREMQTVLDSNIADTSVLSCFVHLYRILPDDSQLFDLLHRHLLHELKALLPILAEVYPTSPTKHLRDLLALRGEKLSEIKALLGHVYPDGGALDIADLVSRALDPSPAEASLHHTLPKSVDNRLGLSQGQIDDIQYNLALLGIDE